jgi:hypothetical protein
VDVDPALAAAPPPPTPALLAFAPALAMAPPADTPPVSCAAPPSLLEQAKTEKTIRHPENARPIMVSNLSDGSAAARKSCMKRARHERNLPIH